MGNCLDFHLLATGRTTAMNAHVQLVNAAHFARGNANVEVSSFHCIIITHPGVHESAWYSESRSTVYPANSALNFEKSDFIFVFKPLKCPM